MPAKNQAVEFVPWPTNQKRLRYLRLLGLDKNEVLNELVARYLQQHVRARCQAMNLALMR